MGNEGRRPSAGPDDDAGFITRSQNGEAAAFEALVERHQRRMLNTAYRMLGDFDEACDVVQEAFLSAYRAIGSFRQEAKFSTWMTTIVLNHARNRLQQRASRACHECRSLDDDRETQDGRIRHEPRSDAESATDLLERKQRDARVQDCIDALEGEQKEVLVLRDIQELSYEEIGSMLKVPDGTVKSRLFRARLAIKDCLSEVIKDLG
ncbi:MAG: sigma-70 family RNA polymerase sigma factor [Deltaproteobacteria bacterium]|nr:sigma-70 family RNA polymerase sigma factor [Deltaproteobacteria bacterium]